jgi:hypothetical protein
MTRDAGFDTKQVSVKPHAKKTIKELMDAALPTANQTMSAGEG